MMKSYVLAWPTVKLVLHEFCGLSECQPSRFTGVYMP